MTNPFPQRPILISASMDATIRIWDVVSQEQLEVLQHKESQINDICITPDGAQGLHTFNVHEKNVTAVGFQVNGDWMFTGGEDCTAKIWDMRVNQLNCQRIFQLPSPIHSVALHPNQVELIVADSTGAIYLWDLRSDRDDSLITEVDMSEYIVHVNVDRTGKQCAAVTNRGQLFIWDLGHTGMMMPVTTAGAMPTELSPPTNMLPTTAAESASNSSAMPLDSVAANYQQQQFVPPDSVPHPENEMIGQQQILPEGVGPRLDQEALVPKPGPSQQHQQKVHMVGLTPLNIPSATAQQLHHNHYLQQQQMLPLQQPQPAQLNSLASNARPCARLRAHQTFALKCRFRPDGMAIATTSADQTTKLWSLSNHKLLETYTVPGNKWVWDCAFTNDSAYMVTATSDGILRMWNMDSAEVVRSYQGHSMGITAMSLLDRP